MATHPTISVVIATRGRPGILRSALQSVADASPPAAELIVVDGDETGSAAPPTREIAATSPFPVHYVPSPPGLTRQRNRGIATATGEVVLFVDDDARISRDVIGRLIAAYADPSVIGVTGRVEEPASHRFGGQRSRLRALLPGGGAEGTFTRFGYPRRLVHPEVARDVEFMPGCFMSARREAAAQLRFDEALPGYGLAEDEDFSCRLSRLGRIRYLPDAVVRHDNSGFGGRDTREFGRQVVRNRAYLFRKNFAQTPLARAQFALLLVLLVGHRLVNRDLRGIVGLVEGAVAELRLHRA